MGLRPPPYVGGYDLFLPKKARSHTAWLNLHNESHLPISAPKNEPLWQKNGGVGKLFTIFFRAFSFLRDFYRPKPLPFSDKRRFEPS